MRTPQRKRNSSRRQVNPPQLATPSSSHRNLAQPASAYVVDEAAHRYLLWNPRMGAQLLQLVPHVFVNILEGVEKSRRNRRGSRAVLDARAQVLFRGQHQAAVGVIDHHE